MSQRLHMQSNLMLPPGVQLELDQRRVVEALTDGVVRHCLAPALVGARQASPPTRVDVGQGGFNRSTLPVGDAADDRKIVTLELVRREELAPLRMRLAAERERHRARGVAVEPMEQPAYPCRPWRCVA